MLGVARQAVAAWALGLGAMAAPLQQPNVVLVVLDDVGVDRVGIYAEHPNPGRTPVLDGLAAQGAWFRDAWAMPLCSPTRASLLTGTYPSRHGVTATIKPHVTVGPHLDPDGWMLPDALTGYSTRAIGKWHLCRKGERLTHPLQCGFDGHTGSMYNLNLTGYWGWRRTTNGVHSTEPRYATTATVEDALGALQVLPEPQFLYVNFNAAHTPFHVPPAHLHTYGQPSSDADLFRAMVEAMDTELGRLVDGIDLSDTYLFVMGDNGTPKGAVTAPHDPLHAKATLYEGGVRVPFLVLGPDVVAGERKALVSITDVFATVVGLTGGGPVPPDSLDMTGVLLDPTSPGRRSFLYAEISNSVGGGGSTPLRAIRSPRYKWMEALQGPELYDLELDPLELNNRINDPLLAEEKARLVAALPTFP